MNVFEKYKLISTVMVVVLLGGSLFFGHKLHPMINYLFGAGSVLGGATFIVASYMEDRADQFTDNY